MRFSPRFGALACGSLTVVPGVRQGSGCRAEPRQALNRQQQLAGRGMDKEELPSEMTGPDQSSHVSKTMGPAESLGFSSRCASRVFKPQLHQFGGFWQ